MRTPSFNHKVVSNSLLLVLLWLWSILTRLVILAVESLAGNRKSTSNDKRRSIVVVLDSFASSPPFLLLLDYSEQHSPYYYKGVVYSYSE